MKFTAVVGSETYSVKVNWTVYCQVDQSRIRRPPERGERPAGLGLRGSLPTVYLVLVYAHSTLIIPPPRTQLRTYSISLTRGS